MNTTNFRGDYHRTSQVQVKTINIEEMMAQFGHPFYIKCDIEGEDKTFIDQIVEAATKPKFLSVEGGGQYYISKLLDAGYTNFQLVNQLLHYKTEPPKPAREGQYFPAKFTNRMSGLFGKELRENRWWPGNKTIDALNKLREIRNIDPDLAPG